MPYCIPLAILCLIVFTSLQTMASRSFSSTLPPETTLRIITCNVRFDGLSSQPVPIPPNGTIQSPRRHWTLEDPYKERPWAERRSRLVDALWFWGADVIGFQVSYVLNPFEFALVNPVLSFSIRIRIPDVPSLLPILNLTVVVLVW
jgi:hypothetical protein